MALTIASYGAGTNSTALLIESVRRKEPVDPILFADTGGERPCTYQYLDLFSHWLESQGYPAVITGKKVDKDGEILTLEQDCIRKKMLPSIAYGHKTCSQKYKIQPQDKFVNNWNLAREVWEKGGKITKLIGYDFDEPQRAKAYNDEKYDFRYPLIEWRYGRDECVEIIKRAGLPLPGKSSCFFCPSMKTWEIRQLRKDYPNLMDRAIAMESNAKDNLTAVKGLGRNWSWTDLIEYERNQIAFEFISTMDVPCGCYDGVCE